MHSLYILTPPFFMENRTLYFLKNWEITCFLISRGITERDQFQNNYNHNNNNVITNQPLTTVALQNRQSTQWEEQSFIFKCKSLKTELKDWHCMIVLDCWTRPIECFYAILFALVVISTIWDKLWVSIVLKRC